MDLDVIFWLVLAGFYLLRLITRKKGKKPAHPRPQPQSQLPQRPQPDVSHMEEGTGSPAEGTRTPAQVEIGQALVEIRTALGFGQSPAPAPPPVQSPRRDSEVFGGSEERFEKEVPVHELKGAREDRIEKRSAYTAPDQDREYAFEEMDFHSRGSDFSDDGFEKKSAWSEVEFKNRWKGHKSDFEYHSPLEKHDQEDSKSELEPIPQITRQSTTDSSPFARLNHVSDLQKAVLLHEILGPPISRRTQSARRRPS